MRKRPKPQLFLHDLPQPGKAVWFNDQEKNNQNAEQRNLHVLGENSLKFEHIDKQVLQADRHEHDESGAQ